MLLRGSPASSGFCGLQRPAHPHAPLGRKREAAASPWKMTYGLVFFSTILFTFKILAEHQLGSPCPLRRQGDGSPPSTRGDRKRGHRPLRPEPAGTCACPAASPRSHPTSLFLTMLLRHQSLSRGSLPTPSPRGVANFMTSGKGGWRQHRIANNRESTENDENFWLADSLRRPQASARPSQPPGTPPSPRAPEAARVTSVY